MKTFPSLPDDPDIMEVYKQFEQFQKPLFSQIEFVMRGESELSIGERELIAAYTSVLNTSSYCVGMHSRIAHAYGVSVDTITSLAEEQFSELTDRHARLFQVRQKGCAYTPRK